MSSYARPTSVDEALDLLLNDGAAVLAGGTDLAGQIDRGITTPSLLVDLQDAGLGGIERDGDGLRIGATTTLADLAADALVAPYAALATAASLAASPLLRNQGTVGGNLCQHTRCWYYRGEEWTCWLGGGDTCFAQIGDHRKHNLEAGDCISAHPSDLAPALAVCVRRSSFARSTESARSRCSTSTAARRTTTARSSRSRAASSSSQCGSRAARRIGVSPHGRAAGVLVPARLGCGCAARRLC